MFCFLHTYPIDLNVLPKGYTKILDLSSPKTIIAMPLIRKLIVLHNDQLNAYSLDIIARILEKKTSASILEQSAERLARAERGESILFFRIGVVADRTLRWFFISYKLWKVFTCTLI